jgi:hypothetical protein
MDPSPPTGRAQSAVLGRYLSLADANLTRSMLRAAGLEAQVRDEYFAGLNWLDILAIGGVRLEVPTEQWDDAQALLSTDSEPIGQTAEELAYLEIARKERRALGKVAIAFMLFPLLGLIAMGLLLMAALLRKDGSPDEQDDE